MSKSIEEVLARRSDLSTFLVHLTRQGNHESARARLESILTSQKLIAQSPFGPAVARLESAGLSTASQKCVCFTETPLEHVSLLLGKIGERDCEFEPYGIAISKKQARRAGANPVWYTDITPGHPWIMNRAIEPLINAAIDTGTYDDKPIASITPFIEQMGSGTHKATKVPYKKEFWWEREWRYMGDFFLPNRLIALCPQDEIADIRQKTKPVDELDMFCPMFVDPHWNLEQIIGRLAGFPDSDLGPF
jgi:hypothetical protein